MQYINQWVIAAIIGLTIPVGFAAGKSGKTQTAAINASQNVNQIDNIVAIVDNGVITQREFDNALEQARMHLPKNATVNANTLKQQVLLQLINQNLLVQAAARTGITVNNADIDEALQKFADGRKLTLEQLYKQVAREGVSKATLRRTMSDNLMAQRMEQSEIMNKGQVTEEEIDEAMARAKQAGRALPPPVTSYTYHAQHILIKNDTEASRKLIRQISEQARAGANFEQLARQYSQDASAAGGGDLGWLSEGQTVAPFEAAMKALKPGQVSQPVRSQFGWHVIRLVDVKSNDSPEQQQRNGMRVVLSQEKREMVLSHLLQQLRQQAYIQIRQ